MIFFVLAIYAWTVPLILGVTYEVLQLPTLTPMDRRIIKAINSIATAAFTATVAYCCYIEWTA